MTVIPAASSTLTTPDMLVSLWQPDAVLFAVVGATMGVYVGGLRRLWGSVGAGQLVSVRQAAAFGGGLVVLVVALVSPLEALAHGLFSAHMVQHLLLALVVAPLLVLGRPTLVVSHRLPDRQRRRVGRWQGHLRRVAGNTLVVAAMAVAGYVATWWLWHVPPVYDAAVTNQAVHRVEHVTLVVSAAAFWGPIIHPRRTPAWAAPLMLLVAGVAAGLLSVLLVFANGAWYTAHQFTVSPWGLTALEDQQLAGAIMWVPGGAVYVLALAWSCVRALQSDDRALRRMQEPVVVAPARAPRGSAHDS